MVDVILKSKTQTCTLAGVYSLSDMSMWATIRFCDCGNEWFLANLYKVRYAIQDEEKKCHEVEFRNKPCSC